MTADDRDTFPELPFTIRTPPITLLPILLHQATAGPCFTGLVRRKEKIAAVWMAVAIRRHAALSV
jgi:hypothetical protein